MTQFRIYRIGKIDGIVRLGALKIAQMITGAIERVFFQQYCHPQRGSEAILASPTACYSLVQSRVLPVKRKTKLQPSRFTRYGK